MNQQGKFLKTIYAFPIFAVLVLMGCGGEAVKIEFPINHPANPEALEADFTPPHNPFSTDVAEITEEPQTDSMMKHKMPEAGGPQHGDHGMGNDKEHRSDPETTIKPDHGGGNHTRKEGHGQ